MNKVNFFLTFSAIFASLEFLSIMVYIIAAQLGLDNLSISEYRVFFIEILTISLASYVLVKNKK